MREQYLTTALMLTGEIEVKQNSLIDLNNEAEDSRGASSLRDSDLIIEIAAEMNDGKPRFSNEAARNAELAKRRAIDPFIKEHQKNLLKANILRAQLSNEITKLQSQVSLYKAFLSGGA